MLKKKCLVYFLTSAITFGGISGVSADPLMQDQGQIRNAEQQDIQTQDGNTQQETGEEEKTKDGDAQQETGREEGTEDGDAQQETGREEGTEDGDVQQETEREEETEDGDAQQETVKEDNTEGESPQQDSGMESGPESGKDLQGNSEMLQEETPNGVAGPTPRITKYYYAGYQVRLDGNLDTSGDLAGLTFTLYEKKPGGTWNSVATAQSKYSSYYRLSYVYFKSFSVESTPVNEYKVVMADTVSYSMQETTVQLDPNSMTQVYGSAIDGNYLNLISKEVPKDNTDIQVSLGFPTWSGSGTADDPYTWSVTVERFTDNITIKTANSKAAILWKGSSYTGKITEDLPYDESIWDFSVKSSDGTKESFYKISVTRTKYTPLPPQNLEAVPPSAINGNDGKIRGLETDKLYEYCSEEEKKNGAGYHQVEAGASEITGLKAGKYYVRFQETWEYEPSSDREVAIKDPVLYKLTLPAENIPAGVEILECPENMVEGHEFTLRFRLPKNRLLEKVSYTKKVGGMTISSSLPKAGFQYSQDGDRTIVTITSEAISGDTILKISLQEGEYYQVRTFSGSGQTGDERGGIILSGDESIQGSVHYFKQGTLTATVDLSQSWKGYAKISSLKAVRKGTGEEVPGTLTQTSDEQWTLEINLDDSIDIYYDFQSFPADFTALNQIIEKIGDLNQYVADSALDTLKARLELLSAYQKQTLKNQAMIDGYVTLLEAGYKDLTLRQNLSEDGGVTISVDEREHVYDGKVWIPEIAVSYQGNILTEGTDYRLNFPEDMVSPGQKEIVVEFIGKYAGQRSVTVSIVRYYTITATAGKNGSISPNGKVMVKEGDSQLFQIWPDSGYHIQAVYVDEKKVTLSNANEYTFKNVTSDAVIKAVFEKDKSEIENSKNTTGTPDKGTSGTTVSKTQSKAVNTADTSQPLLYIAGMLVSLTAFCTVIFKRKRNYKD